MTLEQIWKTEGKRTELKVRYKDWNYKLKFFQITGIDEAKKCFIGINETGETVVYPIHSDHWEIYYEGLENQAKAV
jgi:hypothetical protein